jgi:hypothetical protein
MTVLWKSLLWLLRLRASCCRLTGQFPNTPQEAAAGFSRRSTRATTGAGHFQDANFSDAALKRRPREQRITLGKQLREQADS